MARRPRIQWQQLDGIDAETLWTPGWLPDSPTLRWSLANDLRIESVRDGWQASFTASDAATIYEGWVAEDDGGDYVEVTSDGLVKSDGSRVDDWRPATFARLNSSA